MTCFAATLLWGGMVSDVGNTSISAILYLISWTGSGQGFIRIL